MDGLEGVLAFAARPGAEERAAFDRLDWVEQVRWVASRPLDGAMMRHVADPMLTPDPGPHMALAARPDLPRGVLERLLRDPNPQVRRNAASHGTGGHGDGAHDR